MLDEEMRQLWYTEAAAGYGPWPADQWKDSKAPGRLCIHHDNGVIGSAVFAHAEEFRVKKLKEVGYNAIRSLSLSHEQKALDACDRYGMLVMDEFSDVWTTTKVDFDYGMHMAEWVGA